MPDQPKVKLFDNLAQRFEEGGLIYTKPVTQNTYYDSEDFEPVAGGVVNGQPVIQSANITEYDPNIDTKDRKQPFSDGTTTKRYSRMDQLGEENSDYWRQTKNEVVLYLDQFESRTGAFKDYE